MRGKRHSGIFAFEDQSEDPSDDEIIIPEDLTEISDEDLAALEERAVEAFDALFDSNPEDAETVATLADLAGGIEQLRGEAQRRETARAEAAAEAAALRDRIHAPAEEPEAEADEVEAEAATAEAASETPSAPAAEAVAAAVEDTVVASSNAPIKVEPQVRKTRRINVPLSEIRARAATPEVPEERLAITAAADVPHFQAGYQFANISELSQAMRERARTVPITASGNVDAGPKVATIERSFKHVIGMDSSHDEVDRIIKDLTNQESLVAGGGWCSPSETTYSFFDITCEDGMIDLPEFGVNRGGIRFPVSPSLADVFTGTFTNATNPWLWTETDDILTVTGSTNKPCVRVPCPSFTDVRLECYGICLTAGNLTDNAFPEATQRQIGLLRSAHYHASNQRYIAAMVSLSTAAATGGFFDGAGSFASDILSSIEWAAIDYRTRFGMCEGDVLEVVLPFWAKAPVRADLSARTGIDVDQLAVTDAMINDWFDVRGVRVQWVKDWQVRSGNQPGGSSVTLLYPTTVDFLIFAAGTFARGNGMTLDLGIVRDSVLNAENDHTALWMEECHLIAMFGHVSRRYTVNICAAGRTGQSNITDCHTS